MSIVTPRPVVEVAVPELPAEVVAVPLSAVTALHTVAPTEIVPKVPLKPNPVPLIP
jgi:hypothetical protein